jgi:hypothetical protein
VHCEHRPNEGEAGTITVAHSVFRNGEYAARKVRGAAITHAFLLEDGEIVAVSREHTGIDELHRCGHGDDDRTAAETCIATAQNEFGGHGGQIVNVRGRIGDLRITVVSSQSVLLLRGMNERDSAVLCDLGRHEYLGHDDVLPDGRGVYVGKTKRDNLQCVIVDGVAGFGFDRVSNVTSARYYAVLGQHLFTMELPAPEASAQH